MYIREYRAVRVIVANSKFKIRRRKIMERQRHVEKGENDTVIDR